MPKSWHTNCLLRSHGENVDSISENFRSEVRDHMSSRVGKTAGFDENCVCIESRL
jgi:hypothetical protein